MNQEWKVEDGRQTRFSKRWELCWIDADHLLIIYEYHPEKLWKRVRQLVNARAVIQAIFSDATDNIVVSVKSNLYDEKGYESACIGIQVGMLFLSKGATVTFFVSLEAVELANVTKLSYIDAVNTYVNKTHCVTKDGPRILTQLVTGYTSGGGEILVCPLCWVSRFTGDTSAKLVDGAIMGDSDLLADRFLNADKVTDF